MMRTAKGSFEIKSTPEQVDDSSKAIGAMRIRFDKHFKGPLVATSTVAMMGIMDQKLGSGGYVALERITGSLEGKHGSFCLQHSCTMQRGKPAQQISVVPDSATEELLGLSGQMTIDIADDGEHFYTFNYELPAQG